MYGGPFGREDKSTAPALAALGAVGKTIRWTSWGWAKGSVHEGLPKQQVHTVYFYSLFTQHKYVSFYIKNWKCLFWIYVYVDCFTLICLRRSCFSFQATHEYQNQTLPLLLVLIHVTKFLASIWAVPVQKAKTIGRLESYETSLKKIHKHTI